MNTDLFPSKGEIVKIKFHNNLSPYFSELKEIDEKIIKLILPKSYLPAIGEDILLQFPGDKGLLEMKSSIIDIDKKNEVLILENNGSIRLVERRRYFRVDLNIPLKYRKEERPRYRKHYTHNISGGGIAIIDIFNELKQGDLVDIALDIPTLKEPINVLARVVRLVKGISSYPQVGMIFENIKPVDKKNIILYISQFCDHW